MTCSSPRPPWERDHELATLNHDEFARVQGVTVVDVRPFVIQKV
jgi:hypothetical protein